MRPLNRILEFVAVTATLFATQPATAARPNVVVILTDDQGWGDLSIHGNTNLSTPNIDSLARDGAFRTVLCVPGLFTHAGRVPHGAISSAGWGVERDHRG